MLKVVDENVLVVANDLSRVALGLAPKHPEASDDCRLRCVNVLEEAVRKGKIVLDSESEYLEKYKAHCSFSGQPGVGDAFLRAVLERGYTTWAKRVELKQGGSYKLPKEILSSTFDNDDYLWLAGVLNCDTASCILNAVDSDYAEHNELLVKHNVKVLELC